MKNIKNKIKKIISNIMEIEIKKIHDKTNLITDLKVDSLDIIEIIMAIEEKFNIEIPESEVEKFNTINFITEYIQKNKK
ncbi:acyl carrier protein [Buchnera aphidicola]|uniref:Acyl carrier protein n=1 Tax=Buchnera aphidicola (Therioaphis trifolii) TaxID=1241884 RepID=A0A4D6YKH6_9GAMM|nr:acyl carrier protein [Buchnera aphidicola]QCI27231.1 acyl carrier protein [Buchnera aphidicola (Therioaphis trifolii)]